ncbi:kelch-like protein 34 [Anguilla anguilla]|uniref:kelch-like protein 34 n=1 Tax=Anguilla anguilla TaxID=7936 RepID=UPI0015A772BE|nr:kelch-like protein 34 [Anguilla anguilla]
MSYFLVLSETYGGNVLSRYQRLRMEGRLCDVVLVAGGGTHFPTHRSLLASSSDYFWSLFQEHTHEFQAPTIYLPLLSDVGLSHILDFIYSSWLSMSPSTLEDVLEAACYLQVTSAIQLCSSYIADNLSPDNCCFFANIAARYDMADALSAANSFIAQRMGEFLKPGGGDWEGLLELNADSLRVVLRAEEMPGVQELALLSLLLDWLDHHKLSSLRSNLLLSNIRFALVPPEELTLLCTSRPALQTPFIKSLVLKALEYHQLGACKPLLQTTHSTLRTQTCKVLLVGGGPEADRPEREVLTFDPHLRKFHSLTLLPCRVQHHCVCTLGNFLFVLGGEVVEVDESEKVIGRVVTGQVWRYDPRFQHWEVLAPMSERRAWFSCCMVNRVIHVIGGRSGRGEEEVVLDTVEAYDMQADCWRRAMDLPQPIHGQACATHGGTIYISGGIHGNHHESSREVYSLEPCGSQWEKRAPMSIARYSHQMAVVRDRIYTFLGIYEPFCDIECYNPVQDEWTRLRPLLNDRFCYGLTLLPPPHDEQVLLIGGRKWRDAQEVSTPNVLAYDTESDSWREVCKLPKPLSGTQCTLMHIPDLTET